MSTDFRILDSVSGFVRSQITGNFTPEAAADLADIRNAGCLPVRLRSVEKEIERPTESRNRKTGRNESATGTKNSS
ncbi:MAG: hypothetical protein IT426_00815 [Pirellulales bacterium]|nr:hypothetical protein [Pirellulales bacterium]